MKLSALRANSKNLTTDQHKYKHRKLVTFKEDFN